jgi:hypothetical protein
MTAPRKTRVIPAKAGIHTWSSPVVQGPLVHPLLIAKAGSVIAKQELIAAIHSIFA